MREVKYLSPSSISTYLEDPELFYMRYMADTKIPRPAQTHQMAAGSAFDAYVKSYLVERLGCKTPEFELDTLFEEQVEAHNRERCKPIGKYLFDCYKTSGALADLLIELEKASETPRFELKIEKNVSHDNVISDVVLLGKPDIYWKNREEMPVVLDFKVNGFFGNSSTSPKKGYIIIRDSWDGVPSRGVNTPHKDAQLMLNNGLMININHFMEDIDKDWAQQTSIYSWILEHPVGSKFIVWIDQLVANPQAMGYPKIRIATFRGRVSSEFQINYFNDIKRIWEAIQTNTVVTPERQEILNQQHVAVTDNEFMEVLNCGPKNPW